MICRHCDRAIVCRPRGLCWSCYHKPGVREMYPSTSKYARRGPGDYFSQPPLPDESTEALPGSADKVAVLAERVRRGQQLWHPEDATLADAAVRFGRVG